MSMSRAAAFCRAVSALLFALGFWAATLAMAVESPRSPGGGVGVPGVGVVGVVGVGVPGDGRLLGRDGPLVVTGCVLGELAVVVSFGA